MVLGEPLLKEYLTIFDLENQRLGFFRIPIPPPPPAFELPTVVPEMRTEAGRLQTMMLFTPERVVTNDNVAVWWLVLVSCGIFFIVISVVFFIGWKLKCFGGSEEVKKLTKKVNPNTTADNDALEGSMT